MAVCLTFFGGRVRAANLLVNPGFETNSGHSVPSGWTYFSPPPPADYFGDYWVENDVPAHSRSFYWKEWGALYLPAPTNNVAGIYQAFPSAPGMIYQAGGWFRTSSGDELGTDCVTWIEVDFLNASSNLLAVYKSDNFSASVGADVWFQYPVNNACDLASPVATGDPNFTTYAITNSVSQLVAPPGTTMVRYRYAYLQAGQEGGSAYLDDAVLDQVGGPANGIAPPTGLSVQSGDESVILHWNPNPESNLAGYNVYRSSNSGGGFAARNSSSLVSPGFCDFEVTNGQRYFYQVSALAANSQEGIPSAPVSTVPDAFASDDAFMDYVQQANFDFFWYAANPANGLILDRTVSNSPCSIAAVGFGLTAIGVGIDHGWISRSQGAARVLTTLGTFLQKPQGTNAAGDIGYRGWFYHFLNMNTGLRAPNSELSSVDTALLLSGIVYARQYFNGTNSDEAGIRASADAIVNRVDWNWMAQGTSALSMGWFPPGSFLPNNWHGYNEAMILYLLGLGRATNALSPESWNYWTSGYTWATNYGQAYVVFPPLFGHQYSHCWVDFRHIADSYMNGQNSTYFENSRRATLAQIAYCVANPLNWTGYGTNVWGLTACDDPLTGYEAHGAAPAENDDGTIAPTAVGGSMAFTPEFSLPALKYLYRQYLTNLWTSYGFRDAFNLHTSWYDRDELGIDQGPIVIMIENYRSQRVWNVFMRDADVQRGLRRAGFVSLPFVTLNLEPSPSQKVVRLAWAAVSGRNYQVEYTNDLGAWFSPLNGAVTATNSVAGWTDNGPPNTAGAPFTVPQRFYRVFQLGLP